MRLVPARFLPSGRSLLVGLALLALGAGAYVAARQTSTFAVSRVTIAGGSSAVRHDVRARLAPLLGTSLLALDGAALVRSIDALPTVVSVGYDRSFPHTLRIVIVPEQPVAVLHRGTSTWLLSARGRIVKRLPARTLLGLPRVWVPRATQVAVGGIAAVDGAGAAARALSLATHFPARIATAGIVHRDLVLWLHSGLELRLGQPDDVRLKLAVARRALSTLPAGVLYLDVSVPGRPVAGTKPSSLK